MPLLTPAVARFGRSYQGFIPLFCIESLGWDALYIGYLLSITGIFAMLWQPLFFPPLARRFGMRSCYIWHGWSFAFSCAAVPFMGMLAGREAWLWPVFVAQHSVLWQGGYLTGWGAGTTMIMNSAAPGEMGSTQGLLAVMQAVFNSVAPTAGGALWNATLFLPGAWHPRVCFGCVGVLALGLVWLGVLLPRSLERAKRPG